jgi:heterodisulfide reductase subunit A
MGAGGKSGAVMVVGGGVAGVQAALDLVELGLYVYLVEELPSIGGVMAQLDKTFPTQDCSLCILSPKLVEVSRSPNIKVITRARLERVEGKPGNFTCWVLQRPRYVDVEKCTGCGVCSVYCPTRIPDAYNERLCETKALHMEYPQAVPTAFSIDETSCLFLQRQECKQCVPTCKAGAINFDQKEKLLPFNVGALILAPGFGRIEPKVLGRLGYGRYPDVVTSVEFERILCASGPYQGHILKAGGGHPQRIAFLQCVGSRDCASNAFCSSVCCMYAVKEAIVAKEHAPDLDLTIFAMDLRTQGKNFDATRLRSAKEYGVRFVRAKPARVAQLNGHLELTYVTDVGEHRREPFDMVVLAVGMGAPAGAEALARAAEIDLNRYRFAGSAPAAPLATSRPGVYVAGAFQSPKDIPESVTQASGAAALASQLLREARGTSLTRKELPPEADVRGEEPKIGVFICHCGINIGSVVDVPEVKRYAASLGAVVFADENPYSCSQDTQEKIKEKIKEHGLNRVVVAACTPRTHEPLFQGTIREAGLNRCLFEMVNIRDQCSWVHMKEKAEATAKAKELVRMAVAKAILARPLEEQEVPVVPAGLVIGGGLSGMTAALSLAEQGFSAYLIEKGARLGGNLRRVRTGLDGLNPRALLRELEKRLRAHPLVEVITGASISAINGYVGNFSTTVTAAGQERQLEHGVVIVATGGREARPRRFGLGESDKVLTQLELERRLEDAKAVRDLRQVVMIQCAGSRVEESKRGGLPYCSKLCCSQAVKNALRLKELNPEADVYVLYRDMRTYGFKEDFYRLARQAGVVFIRYEEENPPLVEVTDGAVRVSVEERLLGSRLTFEPDLLALSVGIVPNKVDELARMLKVPLTSEGFFLEAHVKLRPVEFSVEGVYLCGLAHSPKPIEESIAQAEAAAAKAAMPLARGFVAVEPVVSRVETSECIGCGICEALCPYKAIRLVKQEKGKRAETIAASCKGCGVCASHCPAHAITMGRFSDAEIFAQIRAFGQLQEAT